ncbi:hypothetical protein A2483_03805 [Candidatus Peregrinibacteria bacterium RIFOXYC2_FULL_33_13]|nr:MAG: extracellular solute-binding protein [Candidatus Peregrinibacteria bacterium GW2011_GWA2_33_10]KKP41171.1 MAG: MalE-type ABC sugar transport system periplasmic component, multiple sugar transport system substrate-binding protein [Candidatus Peregrinibacteria bacterium GW2011_GWC2_33_13]OGJ53840.1 MAG: hypothetical protein A2483_03805 [Candidatus Peregrinibacteria bacterium RIFOXYC2_FULL_33_13]
MKKIFSFSLIFILLLVSLTGCFKKEKTITSKKQKVELTYYKLFDDETDLLPIIRAFEKKYPYVKINYRKFTNVDEYEQLIINEMAEGEGPDIFEIHNTWLPRHIKKIYPVPEDRINVTQFKSTFLDVAADDLIAYDETDKKEKVYALPLYIDTLALYYNDEVYEEKVPSRGKPPLMWQELLDDVFKIKVEDNSYERFQVSGIAMGRTDNILRGVDILDLLFIQYNAPFYNKDFTKFTFAQNTGVSEVGKIKNPSEEALNFFISFAQNNRKNYSWNKYMAGTSTPEKEIAAFAKGKVAMIAGYSYLYDDIMRQITALGNQGIKVINKEKVLTAPMPQVYKDQQKAYANYFAETVSRTTKHPREAWGFLRFLVSKSSLTEYNKLTKRPSSRRDLIQDQKKDPIYGVFATQVGYARSIPKYSDKIYKQIMDKSVQSVVEGKTNVSDSLKLAENEINKSIPKQGLYFFPPK